MNLSPEKLAELLTSLAAFSTALKTQLGLKLGKDEKAGDAAKLEGKTLAEVIAQAAGSTGADLDALELVVNAFIARRDNPHVVTKEQVGLGLVENYKPATDAEAVTATGVDRVLVPANLAAFWTSKIGAAPETLNTIGKLAAALKNDPLIIDKLQAAIDANTAGKLDKTATAADSSKLGGKTLAEVLEAATGGVDLSNVVLKTDDLGASKVAVTGDAQGAGKTLKTHFEGIAADKTATDTAIEGLSTRLDTTDAAVEAAQAAAVAADGKAVTAQTAAEGAATLAGTKLDATAKAADSSKLEGLTLDEVIAAAGAGADLSAYVKKVDDFGAYKVGATTLTDLFAGVQTDLDALEAAIPVKATPEEIAAGVDDAHYLTVAGAVLVAKAAVDKVVDGAPEALDTLKELADKLVDQDDALAVLVTQLGEKLGKLETAANSLKLEGKTLAQVLADAAAAAKVISDALAARVTALEAATGGEGEFLKTTSDLGGNKVALTGDVAGTEKTLKVLLETLKTGIADNAAAIVVTDGKAVAAKTAADAAQAAADSKLGKTEKAADSDKLNGKTEAQLVAAHAASAAEVTAGTATDKFVTPAALAPSLASIGSNAADLLDLVTQLTTAFNAAADDIDPTPAP